MKRFNVGVLDRPMRPFEELHCLALHWLWLINLVDICIYFN